MTFLEWLSLLLIALKLMGVVEIGWLVVFLPIVIEFVLVVILGIKEI